MERPNKEDYDFNDPFEGARFACYMIQYADYLESKIEAQEQLKILNIPDVVQQSEQFKAIVFKMANMLAVAGKGDQAVQMHRIHNSL